MVASASSVRWHMALALASLLACPMSCGGNHPEGDNSPPDVGEADVCPSGHGESKSCESCATNCDCALGYYCDLGACAAERKGGEHEQCVCGTDCEAGLVCQGGECMANGSQLGLSIEEFRATPSWGDAPLSTTLSWVVASPVGAEPTCHIDLDGDGEDDAIIDACLGPGSLVHTFTDPGAYRPRLRVTNSDGLVSEASIDVFSNFVEFAPEVVFPEDSPGFQSATLEGDKLVLTFDSTRPSQTFPGEGDIVWIRAPRILARVVGVESTGPASVVLNVVAASVTDAIRNCQFGVTAQAPVFPGPSKEAPRSQGAAYAQASLPLSVETSYTLGYTFSYRIANFIKIDIPITAGVDKFYMDVQWGTLKRLQIDSGFGVELDVSLDLKSPLEGEIPLAEVPLGTIPLSFFAWLDIEVEPNLEWEINPLQFIVEAFLKVGLSYGSSIDCDFSIGVCSAQHGLIPIGEATVPFGEGSDTQVDVLATRLALAFDLEFKLWSLCGPVLQPGLYCLLEPSIDLVKKEGCFEVSFGLEGEATVKCELPFNQVLELKGKELSVTLAEWSLAKICKPLSEILGSACGDGLCEIVETACSCSLDCPPACGDGCCDKESEFCQECSDCPDHCGDGLCNCDESFEICPDDCPCDPETRSCGFCGDGACVDDEVCVCTADCDPCGTVNCGDDKCTPNMETYLTCPHDCDPDCGNDVCDLPAENCANCPQDCSVCCGDGLCRAEDNEYCYSCPNDCGPCPWCGDDDCDEDLGENCASCEQDCGSCCGDDTCLDAIGENCLTCPVDCGVCPGCEPNPCTEGEGFIGQACLQSDDGAQEGIATCLLNLLTLCVEISWTGTACTCKADGSTCCESGLCLGKADGDAFCSGNQQLICKLQDDGCVAVGASVTCTNGCLDAKCVCIPGACDLANGAEKVCVPGTSQSVSCTENQEGCIVPVGAAKECAPDGCNPATGDCWDCDDSYCLPFGDVEGTHCVASGQAFEQFTCLMNGSSGCMESTGFLACSGCSADGKTCCPSDPCDGKQTGEHVCIDEKSAPCQESATGCVKAGPAQTCPDGCAEQTGQCIESVCDVVFFNWCDPVTGDVHLYDGCGIDKGLAIDCMGCGCSETACIAPVPAVAKVCHLGNLHEVDSCGNVGAQFQECLCGCLNDKCVLQSPGPSGFAAAAVDDHIHLSWYSVPNATGYFVTRVVGSVAGCPPPGADHVCDVGSSATQCDDHAIQPGQTASYGVYATFAGSAACPDSVCGGKAIATLPAPCVEDICTQNGWAENSTHCLGSLPEDQYLQCVMQQGCLVGKAYGCPTGGICENDTCTGGSDPCFPPDPHCGGYNYDLGLCEGKSRCEGNVLYSCTVSNGCCVTASSLECASIGKECITGNSECTGEQPLDCSLVGKYKCGASTCPFPCAGYDPVTKANCEAWMLSKGGTTGVWGYCPPDKCCEGLPGT